MIYSVITWIGTYTMMNFTVVPFVLLEFRKVIYFYQTWYFAVPIIVVVLACILPGASSKPKPKSKTDEQSKQQQPSTQEVENKKE